MMSQIHFRRRVQMLKALRGGGMEELTSMSGGAGQEYRQVAP